MKDRDTCQKVIVFLCIAAVVCVCWLSRVYGEAGAAINETNFPDPDFREIVDEYDQDGDGFLSEEEIANVHSLHIAYKRVESMKGIKFFTSLEELECIDISRLIELDLSGCTALTRLECSGHFSLEKLDISGCTALKELDCSDNYFLTALDLTGCSSLTALQCTGNDSLEKLNVNGFRSLVTLKCEDNKLTELDAGGCTSLEILECGLNNLTELNISDCIGLQSLYCRENELAALDMDGLTKLEVLNCSYNQISLLDISSCSMLRELECYSNELKVLDLSRCKALEKVDCGGNPLTTLDPSGNPVLKILSCGGVGLSELNISHNPLLETLYCAGNRIRNLDVSGCAALTTLYCEANELTRLDVSGCPNLAGAVRDGERERTHERDYGNCDCIWGRDGKMIVDCTVTVIAGDYTNEASVMIDPDWRDVPVDQTNFPDDSFREYVKQFDTDKDGKLRKRELIAVTEIMIDESDVETLKGIEFFTEIIQLQCRKNKLVELDVSRNTMLDSIDCSGNQLTSLDLKNCTVLTHLKCTDNMLQSLELPECPLVYLNCENNRLRTLDVRGYSGLKTLTCNSNELIELDVHGMPSLDELRCSDNQPMTRLDAGDCPELDYLVCCQNPQLTQVNVSGSKYLETFHCSGNGKLASLDVSSCSWLRELKCSDNQLKTLILNENLLSLDCSHNKLTYLDLHRTLALSSMDEWIEPGYHVEGDTAFTSAGEVGGVCYWVSRTGSFIRSLVVDKSTIIIWDGDIEIDEEHFPDDSFRLYVKQFDKDDNGVFSAEELTSVSEILIHGRGIKDLTGIQYFTALKILRCYDNQITDMQVSALKKLVELDCSDNPIKELDVSKNTYLEVLICGNTYLKTLDLSGNPLLKQLMCEQYCDGWNELTSVNVSFSPALKAIVKEQPYSDSVIPGHPYLYNHSLHGWWIKDENGMLSRYLFVGPDTEVLTDEGVYISNKRKPDAEEKVIAFITRCYEIILERKPDEGGLQTWYRELTSGRKSASEIIDRFVCSPEYFDRYCGDEATVEFLYKVMLGRNPDPEGMAHWVSKLEDCQPIAVVINGFCTSPEFIKICESYGIKPGSVAIPGQPSTPDEKIEAFVTRCYKIILNREPDPSGMDTWFNELKSRRKAASEIIDRFVNSPEFGGKNYSHSDSVEILYKAMLGRDSDAPGKANWVGKLDAGQPFAAVINGFCISHEFKAICASYGIEPGNVKVESLSGRTEEELSMLALNAKEPITRRSETKPNRVEIINPSDTVDMNIGTAVQAVYINEEKAKEFISRCYKEILGREAGPAELENWIGQMVNGTKTPDQIARGFLFSNEFKAKNTGNEDLVKILYRVYMNRDVDPKGLKTWTEKLDEGTGLNELLDVFAKTNEFKAVLKDMAQ